MKFLAGLAVLLLALFLQFELASYGFHFNLALAALIATALVFDFWELLILDLVAIFFINWQSAPSIELIIFTLIPIAAYLSRKVFTWEPWIYCLIAVFLGFLIFYLVGASTIFLVSINHFLVDLVAGFIVGELTFFALA